MLKCRNCKIGVNCNNVAGILAVRLLAVRGQGVVIIAGIEDPKLDSTASHPSSSSHSLPCCVICHPGHPAPTIMGGLVQSACFVYFYCC